MTTHFASAERSSEETLEKQITLASNNPIIDGLMQTISGLLAILNAQRQLIAMNRAMIEQLGLHDSLEIMGLRLGEVVHCAHAHEEEGGCGTSRHCSSCGAAISMVTALAENKPCERNCAISVEKEGMHSELCLKVQAVPIHVEQQTFLMLFIRDITQEQNWALLEKTFLHDLSNVLTGLSGTAETIAEGNRSNNMINNLCMLVSRLKKDLDIQRIISHQKDRNYTLSLESIPLNALFKELEFTYLSNPVALRKKLDIVRSSACPETITTDYSLLLRILTNMIQNAFEATPVGGTIRLWIGQERKRTTFNVWNATLISDNIQRRIFQHHFSTKEGIGHGHGTYSMKLLGEQILDGNVYFSSIPGKGTIFTLALPAS